MNDKINEKVGAWMLIKGNTQSILADKIGITRPTLRSRLDGRSKWTWDEVTAISGLIGCSLDELAGIEETQQDETAVAN